MINLKTPAELAVMASAGQIAARVLNATLARAAAGVATIDLDAFAEEEILKAGAKPSFKGYQGFPYATCINVNEGLVHGFPGPYRLRKGDLLSVDLGVYYCGFHADTSSTVLIDAGQVVRGGRKRFLNAGKKALREALAVCRPGKRVGLISQTIQAVIEAAHYNVARDLVGHGIGRELHEEPSVPCFGRDDQGPKLQPGMALAIEVIYTEGDFQLITADDGWTVKTADGKLGGLFEHTVAITESGPIVLTRTEGSAKMVSLGD